MEDLGADKEFISFEVQKIVDDAIYGCFGIKENEQNQQINHIYQKDQITKWSTKIIDDTVRGLSKLNKPFKYAITCILQQNNGAGMSVSAAGYYDNQTDGFVNCQKEINDIVVMVETKDLFDLTLISKSSLRKYKAFFGIECDEKDLEQTVKQHFHEKLEIEPKQVQEKFLKLKKDDREDPTIAKKKATRHKPKGNLDN